MAEAWVGTLKAELVAGRHFSSFEQHETLSWIDFYNRERLHEELADVPPAEFEHMWRIAQGSEALTGHLRLCEDGTCQAK